MRSELWKRLFWVFGLVLAGIAGSSVRAADHNDSPFLRMPANDHQDINDIYAFQSPSNAQNLVLIMTVNPDAGVRNDGTLDPNTIYEFLVDVNGDARPDINFTLYFSRPNAQGQQSVILQSGRTTLARGTTDQTIPVLGGGKLRVGIYDDPFFFDNRVLQNPPQMGVNAFAGMNVTAMVLEIPSRNLRAANIGVWAITEKNGQQIDRVGRPGINTVLISANNKDAFNEGLPINDKRDFRQDVIDHITALGNGANAAGLADILLPDILTIDTTNPQGFLNGRRLEDDVIDTELDVLTDGKVTSDGVANDSNFANTFPYLAPPNALP